MFCVEVLYGAVEKYLTEVYPIEVFTRVKVLYQYQDYPFRC
jgi:hypothetical protein